MSLPYAQGFCSSNFVNYASALAVVWMRAVYDISQNIMLPGLRVHMRKVHREIAPQEFVRRYILRQRLLFTRHVVYMES